MNNLDQILIRRLPVKTETVKKGWFSKETKFALDGTMCDGERLYRVCENGAIEKIDQDKLPNEEGLRLFAVQYDSFDLTFHADLGPEKEGFRWNLKLSGEAKIKDPISFLRKYYYKAKTEPLTVQSFVCALGTRIENLLLDKIILDSIWEWLKRRTEKERSKGTCKQEETDVLTIDNVNIDFTEWAKERNLTEDEFTNAIREKDGTPFGKNGIVNFVVNSVRIFSEEREAARAAQIADDGIRIKQAQQKAAKSAEREEELEKKAHELKLAELDAQMNKLKVGTTEAAFAAFETISNFLGDAISTSGASPFADILKDARRAESGLHLLALARDKKRTGGVTISKNAPSFQTRSLNYRGFTFSSKKTPAIHHGESISSTITTERQNGWLTVLNISEKNEVIPMLPNADFPAVRIAKGEHVLIGDNASNFISEILENASSGTDHLVTIVSDDPLLKVPLPPLGVTLPQAAVAELVLSLEAMDPSKWAADVASFTILP